MTTECCGEYLRLAADTAFKGSEALIDRNQFYNLRTGGMERSRATLSQLQYRRRPSPTNTLCEANQSVAFAADTNLKALVV
jgi:hypothetical protein